MLKRAAALRKNPPEPEIRLWQELRKSRFDHFKFRRQSIVGNRIADVFCPAKGLIIEIDGDTHDKEVDLRRDAAINREFGYRTIRFTNDDVMQNLDGVLEALAATLERQPDRWPGRSQHHPPTPSSEEEGE